MLHVGKMRSKRQRSAIDAVARVISQVQEAWIEWKPAGMLLMDFNGTFDYVSRNCLLPPMESMVADGDLMK